MDGVLDLVKLNKVQDKYKRWVEHPARTPVFCKVKSINRAEHFQAARSGNKPELVFIVFSGDYHGEEAVIFNDKSYSVYRTYQVPGQDYMELYAERTAGTDGLEDIHGTGI